MATSSTTLLLSSLTLGSTPSINSRNLSFFLLQNRSLNRPKKRVSFVVQAAKPTVGGNSKGAASILASVSWVD
ncbi:hypothetical protein D0Y65_048903 [Glycine soja]|uniref:Uncharacterized protein n=1 Tax=Glycine soja TaxID=3848 RepID=A0A0B2PAU2_GLYSO|nr:hypothetical protein glysoja_041223 [Glycine soja]RZB52619.1 hypothetical protein D0Y65_048903 [Glycine soja]